MGSDIRALARGLSGCLVDTLFVDLDTLIWIFLCVLEDLIAHDKNYVRSSRGYTT